MNNEPVAWAIKSDNDFTEVGFDNELLEEVEQMYAMEGWKYEVIPLYTHPAKTLTDEEITIVKEAVGNYVCTIKMEIDQEKQTFKGYEHCSNLPALKSELKDAEQALAILRKAQEK